MIIGLGWEQIELVSTAKKMGCYILGTSEDKKAEGIELVDEFLTLNPRDLRKCFEIAKKFKPQGVISDACDYSHFACTFLNNILNLKNIGLEAAQLTTNKFWMRAKCKNDGILQPRFVYCKTLTEAKLAVNIINFPLIIKPVDNRGSFGVNIVNSSKDLKMAYFDALQNSHSRGIIVEAFIDGIHITVDGCVDQNMKHHNLAIASKKIRRGFRPIIEEVRYPADFSKALNKKILATNDKVIKSLDIRNGLTHSEYIIDNKERCFLVETANRGGGVLTSSKIIPLISGVNVSKLLVHNALNKKFSINKKYKKDFCILKFFIFKPGKIKRISGLEKVNKIKEVKFLKILIKENQIIKLPKSGAERHGFVIFTSKQKKNIPKIFNKIKKTITISYEKN